MSTFGRVPTSTIQLLQKSVQQVRDNILKVLPPDADESLRAFVCEQVLDTIFRDWSENGNVDGLSDRDVADLCSFVKVAATVAGNDINSSNRPVFEAVLAGLLEDWLLNWNQEG